MKRRDFIKYSAIGAGAVSFFGPAVLLQAAEILPKKGKRVVVAGGGFGGATAAKYLKMIDPKLDVVLIEEQEQFISCPVSNMVLAGLKEMKDITFSYKTLAKKYGIKILQAKITDIDPVKQRVTTSKGSVSYDRMILSPGIDFQYDTVKGLDEEARTLFPPALKAGRQTMQLRNSLVALKPGEHVVITVPEAPYRCPPGPYERASMIAWYLKNNKPGSKVFVIDANPDVVSKGKLFKSAWNDYYSGILEYHKDTEIKEIKAATRTVSTANGEFQGGVLNIIPEQRAGGMAQFAGLLPAGRRWVPVSPISFESTVQKKIHVIGDATDGDVIGTLPKSGFVASAMGKAAAASVVSMLNGKEPLPPYLANTCYSMVNDKEGIYVTGVFEYDPSSRKLSAKKAAGAVSSARSELFGHQAEDWALGIWSDMLG